MTEIKQGRLDEIKSLLGRIPYGTVDFFITKLEEELERYEGNPLDFSTLLNRLATIWMDDNRKLVIERLEKIRLQPEQIEQLTETLKDLVNHADSMPPKDRDRIDRAVARVSKLLPIENAWSVIERWFGDHRAFRRKVMIRVLREHGIPMSHAKEIVHQFRASQDRDLLKLISLNPHVAALVDENDIFGVLETPVRDYVLGSTTLGTGEIFTLRAIDSDTRYWKMRAVELLIIGGRVPNETIAFRHTMAFIWAVGRQSDRASLPLLRRVLDHFNENPEVVWRSIRALERMGDPEDISRAKEYAKRILADRVLHATPSESL